MTRAALLLVSLLIAPDAPPQPEVRGARKKRAFSAGLLRRRAARVLIGKTL